MKSKPIHVLVHAGYHKTGTSSLQSFFDRNKSTLRDHVHYYGKTDFLAPGTHARIFVQRPFPWRLWKFRRSFRQFLLSIEDFHTILLSRETFSGGMPGHRKIGGRLIYQYHPAAKRLSVVIVDEIRRRFGPDTAITFIYTTRETESWIKSVHGHLLRSIRLTDDFQSFRARFPKLIGPKEEAAKMAEVLSPVAVKTLALEDYCTHVEGPAAGVLDILKIPVKLRGNLKPATHANAGQGPKSRMAFLELNKSSYDKASLKTQKESLVRSAQSEGKS